jgi:integrase
MLLIDFVGTYADYRPIRPSTEAQYQYCVQSFEKHLGRRATTADLTATTVNQWLRHLTEIGSVHTAHSRRCTLLSIWRLAAELELVEPPRRVRKVVRPAHLVDAISAGQCRDLVTSSAALRGKFRGYLWRDLMRTWIVAALETSLRPGDMLRLSWSHVVESGGHLPIIQEKTGKPRRISLSQSLMKDIGTWHKPAGPIWPISRQSVGRRLKSLGERVGVPGLTHTDLRKAAITDVERQCPGTGWIFAGHSSPATTQGWYIDSVSAYRNIPSPTLLGAN